MSRKPILAAALAISIAALSLPGAAEAGHRRHRHGDAAAAAAIGLGVGVILGSAFSRPRHYSDRRYDQPVRYGLRPWTRAWYNYCSDRYRSFNPRTGYYLGYDGRYHFCD